MDRDADRAAGAHSYIAYYPSVPEACTRIATIAARARDEANRLRHGPSHAMTTAGVAAYYLTAPGARSVAARPVRDRVAGELRPLVTPILVLFRAWRVAKRIRARRSSRAAWWRSAR